MASKRPGRSTGERTVPRSTTPHRKLMAAVLQAALDDVRDAAARTNALAYLESSDRSWPFSFENLCEALDMNAADVRRQLMVG